MQPEFGMNFCATIISGIDFTCYTKGYYDKISEEIRALLIKIRNKLSKIFEALIELKICSK